MGATTNWPRIIVIDWFATLLPGVCTYAAVMVYVPGTRPGIVILAGEKTKGAPMPPFRSIGVPIGLPLMANWICPWAVVLSTENWIGVLGSARSLFE